MRAGPSELRWGAEVRRAEIGLARRKPHLYAATMAARSPAVPKVEVARLAARVAELERAHGDLVRQKEASDRRVSVLEKQLAAARSALAKARATIRQYRHLLFGRQSEKGPVAGGDRGAGAGAEPSDDEPEDGQEPEATGKPREAEPTQGQEQQGRRKRGRPTGHKGEGRHVIEGLASRKHVCTLDEHERKCPHCGKLYRPIPGAFAGSRVLNWTVLLFYDLYLRQKYVADCDCAPAERILVAPGPKKVVPKSMFSVEFIARFWVAKYWHAMPLFRLLSALSLDSPQRPCSIGGLTRASKRLMPMLKPLYDAICERVRQGVLAAADETTARVLCPDGDPKHKTLWWTWAFKAGQAVAFLVRRGRDADVPFAFFGWDRTQPPPITPHLILLTDCYISYKCLRGWILAAYCWAHLRRRFLQAALTQNSEPVRLWAEAWRRRFSTLYKLEQARRAAEPGSEAWQEADEALRAHVTDVFATAKCELTTPLLPVQTAVLRSLCKHADGLTVFLDHPEVPLDNNEMERILRTPVVGRKNFLFFGAPWAAELAEMVWSILATAHCNGLNVLTYLCAYLQACAEHGGPLTGEALERFLPWRLSEADRQAWSAPCRRS